MSNERTPLTASSVPAGPSYVFPGVSPRTRKRQIRQFQCCICALFMAVLILALVVTISYSVNEDPNPAGTTTAPSIENATESGPATPDPTNITDILVFLLEMNQPVEDEVPHPWYLPDPISEQEKSDAENSGLKALGDREIMEENLSSPDINSPSFKHQKAISSSPEARKHTKRGFVEYHATVHLAKYYNFTKKKGRSDIGDGPKMNLRIPSDEVECDFNSKFRTTNGTCNNKKNPSTFGVAMRPFRRSLRPDYGDGIASPRTSHSGVELPSARIVSIQIHRPYYSSDPNFTVMLAVWGQFVDHDITATAGTQGPDGQPIECCKSGVEKHPECFPVPLGPGDPYYDGYNITCMNFLRSAPAPTGHFGPRQQLNQATAFIDGSVVYGNIEQKQNALRGRNNGLLRMFVTQDNRTLLPISTDPNDGCNQIEMIAKGRYCFESGDTRANENLHLTSMHLLLARHHNFLAENLQQINPEWDDERVFQEARKILGAQMQHITYNEFLPILLGREFSDKKGILPKPNSTVDTYNDGVDASIANSFAGSAFRFAHTLIPGLMRYTAEKNNTPEAVNLHKMLFNPYSLWNDRGIDKALGSAINTMLARSDQYFTTELTQKLFQEYQTEQKTKRIHAGLDLVSLNIQRGRDHGLPAYSEYRKHCGLPPTDTWDQMAKAVDKNSLENMKVIYKDPKDVDLYTGSLSEPPLPNAIFGPLLSCLVSDQFIRLKRGDSFWYERRRGAQRFTNDQLHEIYKTTLAGIICQNSDEIEKSQKYVMQKVDTETNPVTDCVDLKDFDFNPWAEANQKENSTKIHGSSSEFLVAVVPRSENTTSLPVTPLT